MIYFRLLIYILIAEIVIAGNGRWSEAYLGFSVRKVLLLLIFVILFITYINKRILRTELRLVLVPIIAWLLWGVGIPLLEGTSLDQSFAESQVLFGFALYPLILSVVGLKGYFKYINYVIFILSANALMHILLFISFLGVIPYSDLILNYMYSFLNTYNDTSVNLSMSEHGVRAGWIGSAFLMLGIGFIPLSNLSRPQKYLFYILFCLALLITGLRGLIASLILSFVLAKFIVKYISGSNISIAVSVFFSILIGAALVAIASDPNMMDNIGLSRSSSDQVRSEQTSLLLGEFLNYPIAGKGFGSTVSNFDRPEEATFAFEQYVLSLLMKTGLLGLCSLIYYIYQWCIYFDIKSVLNRRSDRRIILFYFLFMLLTIFIGSTSNPYLFNFVGFGYILILLIALKYCLVSSKLS